MAAKKSATKTLTVKEFAEIHECDSIIAGAVLRWLVMKKIAKAAGTRPPAKGFGKAANLFEVPVGEIKLTLISVVGAHEEEE